MVHQVIRILVYADDKKEAREKAEEVLMNKMVGDEKPFDYGTFFDDKTASGKARWGKITPVCLASSKEGKKLIDEGMTYTRDEFKEGLEEVKKLVNEYAPAELFEETILDTKHKVLNALKEENGNPLFMFKHKCFRLGSYGGSGIYLYDFDGAGIRNSEHLKTVLTKWNEGKKVWVVPVDVHF